MNCPQCDLALSASDQFCPECGYSAERDFSRPVVQPALVRRAESRSSRQAPKRRPKIFGGIAAIIVAGLVGWFLLRPDQPDWQENLQVRWQKARVALAPTPENCGAMAPDECRWVAEANRILRGSLAVEKRAGEPPASRLTRIAAQVSQAKADYLLLPDVPPRCFAARSLLSRALAEAKISVTLAKRALEQITPGAKAGANRPVSAVVKSANQHRQRAGELYLACAGELERLFNSPN